MLVTQKKYLVYQFSPFSRPNELINCESNKLITELRRWSLTSTVHLFFSCTVLYVFISLTAYFLHSFQTRSSSSVKQFNSTVRVITTQFTGQILAHLGDWQVCRRRRRVDNIRANIFTSVHLQSFPRLPVISPSKFKTQGLTCFWPTATDWLSLRAQIQQKQAPWHWNISHVWSRFRPEVMTLFTTSMCSWTRAPSSDSHPAASVV